MEYIKKDETTLKVVKPIEEVREYNLDFLRDQEIAILRQKNEFVAERDKELEEVRALIAKCEELGVKSQKEIDLANEISKEKV